MQFPLPLPCGARVALIAPASPLCPRALLEESVSALGGLGFSPVVYPSAAGQDGYLAASDEIRAQDVMRAFSDETIDAVFCLRGGYGCMRILSRLDYGVLRRNPKPLFGFSDVTALSLALLKKADLASVHAPFPFRYATLEAGARKRLSEIFSGQLSASYTPDDGLYCLHPGRVCAPMFGGNLGLVAALLASDYCPDLDGCVLFLEEVDEQLYRLDRLLYTLSLARVFERVGGLVLGQFTDCGKAEEIARILRENTPASLPVLGGFPAGHTLNNHAFVQGQTVTLCATDACLKFQSHP